MTTKKELPVEATEEPEIESTDEEAERAERAGRASERLQRGGDPLTLANPDNPLRMPGEMSARPRSSPVPGQAEDQQARTGSKRRPGGE